MEIPERLKSALSQPAKPETEHDTGLRFTDILFGFVISQVFVRLQSWGELPGYVRWQLIASTALVLGSWIGFRRSFNRSTYQLKFFNLPLLRFILDQLMVILYFRVAILTPTDPSKPVDPSKLANETLMALLFIFALYALWDMGGLLMSWRWTSAASKYPGSNADWVGLAITIVFLAGFATLAHLATEMHVNGSRASLLLAAGTILLLAYRWFKDIRTSWRTLKV